MPVIQPNNALFVRPDEGARLWRYVNLAKYLSLVSTGMLWFSRADLLGDPFEGSVSQANVRERPEVYAEVIDAGHAQAVEHALEQMELARRDAARHQYVSCWHCSEWESAAMWRLYMRDYGIALLSNYGRMREALGGDENIVVSLVRYADYEADWIPEGNVLAPFLYKRRSFEHEREVRAVISRFPTRPDANAEGGVVLDYTLPSPEGIAVPAKPSQLIEEVRVAPDAPSWFADLVRDVTQRYGFEFPVSQSALGGTPVY